MHEMQWTEYGNILGEMKAIILQEDWDNRINRNLASNCIRIGNKHIKMTYLRALEKITKWVNNYCKADYCWQDSVISNPTEVER